MLAASGAALLVEAGGATAWQAVARSGSVTAASGTGPQRCIVALAILLRFGAGCESCAAPGAATAEPAAADAVRAAAAEPAAAVEAPAGGGLAGEPGPNCRAGAGAVATGSGLTAASGRGSAAAPLAPGSGWSKRGSSGHSSSRNGAPTAPRITSNIGPVRAGSDDGILRRLPRRRFDSNSKRLRSVNAPGSRNVFTSNGWQLAILSLLLLPVWPAVIGQRTPKPTEILLIWGALSF